jgi:phosphoribosylglycinamide formyltransferase 1
MLSDKGINLAIFISGTGTTMKAIIQATKKNGLLYQKVNPVIVIASRPDAGGIKLAEELGTPVKVVERKNFENGQLFGMKILSYLNELNVQYISQNGWLPFTPKNVLEFYKDKIFNQHPGPTEFGGRGMHGIAVHAAVLEFQCLTGRNFPTEAVVHCVSPVVDGGAVVARQEVQVLPNDTPEMLAARVLPEEHKLQIKFWQSVYQGNINELIRAVPLIHNNEEQKLSKAIQNGIIYARGVNSKS